VSSPKFGNGDTSPTYDNYIDQYRSPASMNQELLKKHNNINAVASDLTVKHSTIPLNAIFNPVLDKFK
jgi:hypothetical protein